MSDLFTVLHLTDHHFPFVDERALALSMNALRMLQPDAVVFGGDLIDVYALSRFRKASDKFHSLQHELDSAIGYLEECRQTSPASEFHLTPGNHEERIYKYVDTVAPGLGTLRTLALADLFSADRIGLKVHDFVGGPVFGDLLYTHGAMIRKGAGNSAAAMAERYGSSVAMGHSHRLAATPCVRGKYIWYAYESACLCKCPLDYMTVPPDWQNGLSLFVFSGPKKENHTWIPIPFAQTDPLTLLEPFARNLPTRKPSKTSRKRRSKTTRKSKAKATSSR